VVQRSGGGRTGPNQTTLLNCLHPVGQDYYYLYNIFFCARILGFCSASPSHIRYDHYYCFIEVKTHTFYSRPVN
jgi:hypothetical protein